MKLSWRLFAAGWLIVLVGALLASFIQTSGGVSVTKVRYPGPGGIELAAMLYKPATATPEKRAPGVMVSHGLINTREMQSPFAIELARRGFVVLAIDMAGHGESGGTLRAPGMGGPDGLRYLRALPYVDPNNIGLEGHSMGGTPIQAAAAAMPDGYKAMVLEGSSTSFGRGGGGAGPRNLAIVFGQYDEFARTMWGVPKGADIETSARLRGVFKTGDAPVEEGKLYGSIADGTARILHNPAVTHPQEHFTTQGVAPAIDWFMQTLDGEASALPASDSIWLWKDVGTLIAFAGLVVLMLGTFELALSLPAFAALRNAAEPGSDKRDWKWFVALATTIVIPAATFYSFMGYGADWFRSSAIFNQSINNQLAVWALLNGAIAFALGFLLMRGKPQLNHKPVQAILIALAVVGVGYLSLVLVDAVFNVDYRFWVLALKPLDARRAVAFFTYLPLFTVFFLVGIRALNLGLGVKGESMATALVTAALAMSLGFVGLLVIQYGSMLTTGQLASPNQSLNTIIAYQFVPVLAVVGVIAAWTYRRTNSWLPGALICGLFVTWYVVSGTAFYPPAAARPAAGAAATATSTPAATPTGAPSPAGAN